MKQELDPVWGAIIKLSSLYDYAKKNKPNTLVPGNWRWWESLAGMELMCIPLESPIGTGEKSATLFIQQALPMCLSGSSTKERQVKHHLSSSEVSPLHMKFRGAHQGSICLLFSYVNWGTRTFAGCSLLRFECKCSPQIPVLEHLVPPVAVAVLGNGNLVRTSGSLGMGLSGNICPWF